MTSRQTDPDLDHQRSGRAVEGGDHIQLVDIGMEDAVDEANTWTLVRILIRKLDVDFPKTSSKWSCPDARLAQRKG